ncbi:hypothetical protein WJT74_05060 [Sphingomicrobium sp. XHP0239]|uniref:hypothetical protein n=1 Tax=Sphingomicrobium maritimum TaxID=3133972 RepID=UPI0031CC7763
MENEAEPRALRGAAAIMGYANSRIEGDGKLSIRAVYRLCEGGDIRCRRLGGILMSTTLWVDEALGLAPAADEAA